jgi:hypothetical protein
MWRRPPQAHPGCRTYAHPEARRHVPDLDPHGNIAGHPETTGIASFRPAGGFDVPRFNLNTSTRTQGPLFGLETTRPSYYSLSLGGFRRPFRRVRRSAVA